ncbi:hypothetical protein M378DRAFT_70441 [Amanita muscaria Koide BX008]|uniref:Zn(2)-C6 fungal-type domain-containing protein n=1 Tax=Amanita muscaria (strain Koide BX008) TaxID=946122 RepID=A0A0C2XIQ7_AMAMK|nr:hypothetical protein M378DRAFT_70441 [Amanita muscaria Koide BX008]
MEDSFQFIIESPQHNQGAKKRPRLVTSCDNCRLKKIKCLQPSPETKCEACRAAKIPCRFKDRERYFAERSRAIAGNNNTTNYPGDATSDSNAAMEAFSVASNSGSPSVPHQSIPRSSSHSPKASGLATPENDFNTRYQPYPTDSRRSIDSTHRHSNSVPITPFHPQRASDSVGYQYMAPNGPQTVPPPHSQAGRPASQQINTRPLVLLDPDRPERPSSTLMPHFIQTFFEHLGVEFSFLNYEDTLQNYWDQRLPVLLANCIAAVASRYSTYPELTVRGLHTVSEVYLENAKNLLQPIAHIPAFETLHSLILLCWAEYKNHRLHGFRGYYQMVMKMAMDLGLSEQDASPVPNNDSDHNRRRSTWASIVRLHIMASQCEFFL